MEHLPPQDDQLIRVPFVAERRVYTTEEFFSLPKSLDCSVTELMQSGPGILPEEKAASFLQSWLFFALMAQVLDRDIDAIPFLHQRHGRPELRTVHLPELLNTTSWVSSKRIHRTNSIQNGDEKFYGMRASLALDEARKFVLDWCSDNDQNSFENSHEDELPTSWTKGSGKWFRRRYPELCLSFAIIGETLDRYRRINWVAPSLEDTPFPAWQARPNDQRNWGYSDLLRRRMRRLGWCPHEIRRINMTAGDLSSVYYVSSIKPVKEVDHSTCTVHGCSRPTSIGAQHTLSCPYKSPETIGFMPNQERLVEIVLAGNIPLLQYTRTEELVLSEYFVDDASAEETSNGSNTAFEPPRFVAISHAWSDGLGPAEGRGLPQCQLVRIRDTLLKHPDTRDLPFWIDSLCIPQRLDAKNKAIQNMGQVYGSAYSVLVLDSNLRSTSCIPETLEATVRITTGNWSKRMWTLPEGVVAQNLHFDFRDGLLSMAELRQRYERAKRNPTHPEHHVHKAGWLFNPYMFSMRYKSDESAKSRAEHQRVAQVWQAMQWRETSRGQDETLCLARMLDLDPISLLLIVGSNIQSDRMLEFLKLMDRHVGIPPSMIFLPGPKLDIAGMRWAPSTWMNKQSRTFADPLFVRAQKLSFLTANGFHVQYPGIQLYPGRKAIEDVFWIPTDENLSHWYRVATIPDSDAPRAWAAIWAAACEGGEFPAIIRSRFDQTTEKEIALLVKVVAQRKEQQQHEAGVRSNRADVLWAHSLCRVWIQWETDHAIAAKLTEQFRYSIHEMTWAHALGPEQRWVVDGHPWG